MPGSRAPDDYEEYFEGLEPGPWVSPVKAHLREGRPVRASWRRLVANWREKNDVALRAASALRMHLATPKEATVALDEAKLAWDLLPVEEQRLVQRENIRLTAARRMEPRSVRGP